MNWFCLFVNTHNLILYEQRKNALSHLQKVNVTPNNM